MSVCYVVNIRYKGFNIRVVDFVNYDSVLIAAFGLLYEVVCMTVMGV